MAEITEADRKAVDALYGPSIGYDDAHPILQAFATHREAERKAIVAMVRNYADEIAQYHSTAPGFVREVANMIEAGAHRG